MNIRTLLTLTILILCSSNSFAANRALLIGVTEYEQKRFNLSGIEKDLVTMSQFAELLGYEKNQIRTLTGTEVTRENVQNEFDQFLTDGVGPNDSVLIYYSGHGVQIRDESDDETDGRDEALTMYDLALIPKGYSGLLADDELQHMLNDLPSRNIMLVVDACHSGTVTRSLTTSVTLASRAFGNNYQIKALPYRGEPTRGLGNMGKAIEASAEGLIALSAAQDDEQALATNLGSTFTLSLFTALQQLRDEATPEQLINMSKSLIKEKIDPESLFTPNISGDPTLATRPFKAVSAEDRGDVYWQQLESLSRNRPGLTISGLDKRYVSNQEISLKIDIPSDGYLNIVLVDGEDSPVVLYPNAFSTDNFVKKGKHILPGSSEYGWYAQSPWGRNMLVALLSKEPLDLTSNNLNNGTDGISVFPFIPPSPVDMDNLFTLFSEPDTDHQIAETVYFETCQDDQACWQ
ncbi:MAG: caspase family protein [Granulosicoccus sp.]|nr:caspase family protein [Granulosicoccus sp.]